MECWRLLLRELFVKETYAFWSDTHQSYYWDPKQSCREKLTCTANNTATATKVNNPYVCIYSHGRSQARYRSSPSRYRCSYFPTIWTLSLLHLAVRLSLHSDTSTRSAIPCPRSFHICSRPSTIPFSRLYLDLCPCDIPSPACCPYDT